MEPGVGRETERFRPRRKDRFDRFPERGSKPAQDAVESEGTGTGAANFAAR